MTSGHIDQNSNRNINEFAHYTASKIAYSLVLIIRDFLQVFVILLVSFKEPHLVVPVLE